MTSIVITSASAIKLRERSIQLLLEKNKSVHFIFRRVDYNVAKSERNINIPLEPNYQNDICLNKFIIKSDKLTCYLLNYYSASFSNLIHKAKVMIIKNLKRLASSFELISLPIPSFYLKPSIIEDIVNFIVLRLFYSLREDLNNIKRIKGKNK